MKLDNRLILVLVAAIGIYAIFLFMSDFNIISEKISNFKIYYLPLILLLVTVSWIPLIIRWQFLLKTSEIYIPFTKSILVYLSGSALQITPGQIGELIKAQILKTGFNIPRTKTAPVVLVEKVYDLIGAIIASIIGIIILELEIYLIIFAIFVLALIFFFIYYKPAFEFFLKQIIKMKFFSKYTENILESYEIIKKITTPQIAIRSISLSITYWFIVSIAVYYTLLAFDIDILNYLKVLSIFTTSTILGAITFIPGGIGVTEGSIAGFFTLEGINMSTALVLSVMIRIVTLWYNVSIGFIALKFSSGFSFQQKT
tara:strand:+ start:468 stop:1409 length:942 start_codon:yes stop_codon:yes gene_type:complete